MSLYNLFLLLETDRNSEHTDSLVCSNTLSRSKSALHSFPQSSIDEPYALARNIQVSKKYLVGFIESLLFIQDHGAS